MPVLQAPRGPVEISDPNHVPELFVNGLIVSSRIIMPVEMAKQLAQAVGQSAAGPVPQPGPIGNA